MAVHGGTRGPGPDGAEPRRGGAESGPGGAPAEPGGRDQAGFTAAERLALLREFEASGQGMRDFCASRGITTSTLCKWRRRHAAEGEAGLEDRPNPRHAGKRGRRPYPPEERRKAVEAFARSGTTAAPTANAATPPPRSSSRRSLI